MAHVLLVEDDALTLQLYRKLLENEGHTVTALTDGNDAMGYLMNNVPDMVVLDMYLPHVSGFVILQYIRAEARLSHLRVLVISANTNTARVEESDAADVVLMKPIPNTQFKQMVRRLIGAS